MQPFTTLTSTAVPLPLPNIDTDQIIPKQFLKRIERTGYGEFLFYDWRYDLDTPDHVAERRDFVLNKPEYKGSEILIAELRLWFVSRTRGMGYLSVRLPCCDRAKLCGHLLLQRRQKRHCAGAPAGGAG